MILREIIVSGQSNNFLNLSEFVSHSGQNVPGLATLLRALCSIIIKAREFRNSFYVKWVGKKAFIFITIGRKKGIYPS